MTGPCTRDHRPSDSSQALHSTATIGSCLCPGCLVAAHLDLADTLAVRFRGKGEPYDDLVQVARLGLVLAARRFKPEAGISFGGFAVPTILGELRRHMRDHVWMVRPPRSLQELRSVAVAASEQLTQDLQRAAAVDEVAESLCLPTDRVAEAMALESAFRPDSLDSPNTWGEAAEVLQAPQTRLEEVEGRISLAPSLDSLPTPNRQVLRLRYVGELSQRRIADVVGVSQMQVSRLLRESHDIVRRSLVSPN